MVIPLVPFAKGPEWETSIGRCTYEPFKSYRIQLFNGASCHLYPCIRKLTSTPDTPFPIDPFKFVADPIEQQAFGSGSGQSHAQTADGFVIPALPPHVAKSASALPTSSSMTSNGTASPAKRTVLAPKNPFPDAHLPHLLARIEALATSSLQGIVETVHRELQVHKVKKNAIEAKVREVGEKCKEKKVWVVKPSVKASSACLAFGGVVTVH